jgi:Protein of unknown function (DUF998)
MQHAPTVSTRNPSAAARILLAAGIAAGPVYVLVGLVEAVTRSGFDLTRHSLSLLTNGDLGWIHMVMLVTTGLLTMAGAVGLRQSLTGGPGRSWGPILVGVYGAGLVAAGLLTADPAQGFPPGTPAGPPATISWHGLGHLAAGGIGFLCLIGGCVVFARRFASQGERGWAAYSLATGAVFLAGFAGIASGNQVGWVNLAFGAAVVAAWVWVSAVCARAGAQRS